MGYNFPPASVVTLNVDPAELAAYINMMETDVCGEWHLGGWPICDEDHEQGRRLLQAIGAVSAYRITP